MSALLRRGLLATKEIMTIKEAADVLDLSKSWIYLAIRQGKIRVIRERKHGIMRVNVEEVSAYYFSQERAGIGRPRTTTETCAECGGKPVVCKNLCSRCYNRAQWKLKKEKRNGKS